jgi:hypothetical protein
MASRMFRLPPLAQPTFDPQMMDAPSLYGSIQQPPPLAPPDYATMPNASAPPSLKSPGRQYIEQARIPDPPKRTGVKRYLGAFLEGGVPGVVDEALNRDYNDKMRQYQVDSANAKLAYETGRQEEQDDTNRLYKESISRNMANVAEDRAERRKQDARQQQIELASGRWQEAQPGTLAPPQQPGHPAMTDTMTLDGKTYTRPSAYADLRAKKEAEEVNYREVPPAVASKLGLKPGTKVPPNELDSYLRMVVNAEEREADRTARAELQQERLAVTKALGSMAQATRAGQADFRNTMQMANAYRTEQPVKALYDVKQAYEAMSSAGNDGAGDVTLMRLFAKITDPTTGVREEEYRTMQGAGGVMNTMNVFLSGGWAKGQRLDPTTRAAFLRIAQQILKNREKAVSEVKTRYGKRAAAFGVDPTLIFDEDAVPQTQPAQPQGGTAVEEWGRGPDGKLRRNK